MLHSLQSRGGMVTAPHHLAAQAGAAVLREGGNAVEAMVATAAAIAVVYPHMNSLGGDGFWLIHTPGAAAPVAVRACGGAAQAADAAFYQAHGDAAIPTRGPRAALTVAGAIGGWAEALEVARAWGGKPLPLARLLEDAIRHAREGMPITTSQVELTRTKWAELEHVPGFAAAFAPEGQPRRGDTLRQPRIAATLQRLAEAGLHDFYRGDLARSIARDLQALGSPLALADLEGWQAQRVAPLSVQLSAGSVFNQPPPTQGVSSLAILGLFDRLGVGQAEGFDHVHGLVESTKRAFAWRNKHVGDPAYMRADPAAFLQAAALDAEAARIDKARAAPWPEPTEPGDTVWMGAADAQGNVVSYIQSIYWEFGSGIVLPETGLHWQNRGASFTLGAGPNQLAPGRLPFHTLNPALAHLKDGRVLAYGTMGGEGQPQTQAAVFTRHVLFGQDMQAAVTAPRWLLGRTWGDHSTNLKLESRADPALVDQLRAAGHDVQVVGAFEDMMGHAGAVAFHPDGRIEGATDPRADGVCAAV
ncbi:gamma-glutamyltransferase [Acidovorax sp. LjRoot66]|uniref:gamma-glutamyltransferase family protein n=1 Tax=Acidovorax sp. LjRoot66 TaxID=3342334 RepID=UPI003ED0C8DC